MKLQFKASLPPIQSALNIGGAKSDGIRLKLDIPGSEMAEAAKMIMLQGVTFDVTVEAELSDED
jgi:hypothetical protein